ncbi:MAG: hypothetical protein ACHQUC_05085 [Chlamydiales bacterium]
MMKKCCFLSAIGMALIPFFSFALDVELTNSIERISTGFPIEPSLSRDGKRAYLVYEINVEDSVSPPINLAAEIFTNREGKLHSDAILIGDDQFFSIDDGFANPDFTKFSLIDDDGIQAVRVRIFDQNFKVQAERVFTDFVGGNPANPFYSALGGTFSDDGKYIVFSYLIDGTPDHQKTIVRVLDAEQLSEVTHTKVHGGSPGSTFFSFNHENYVALTTYEGEFFFAFNNPLAAQPSKLKIFKFDDKQLKCVDEALLPQQSGVPTTFSSCGKVLIGIGTARAVLKGEETIFADNSGNQSFLPHDNRELRLYSFDGRRLKLVLAEETGVTTNSPIFSSKDLVLVNEQAVDGSPGSFNLFSLKKQLEGKLKLSWIEGAFVSPPFHTSTFSENGKWLLVTGSDQSVDLNDINLYRIGSSHQ